MSYSGLSGKSCIVTGAGGAIGSAVVARLLDEGASVVAADLRDDALASLSGSDGLRVQEVDVTRPESVRALFDAAEDAFGKVQCLVNAHGVLGASGPIAELEDGDFDQVWDVNVKGVFVTMREGLSRMIGAGHGGGIVNISSVAALRARPDRALYGASKRAVIALTRSAAAENGQHGIRVNAVAPGAIESPMLDALAQSAGVGRWGGDHRPIARNGEPAEVASTIAWLLSDDASYCTGCVMSVDGGLAI